jgi:hypothetical protein
LLTPAKIVAAFTPSPIPADGSNVSYMGYFVDYDTTVYTNCTDNRYIGENSTVFEMINSH